MWSLNGGGLFIEVVSRAGLTVVRIIIGAPRASDIISLTLREAKTGLTILAIFP